jgi:AraC-like DNA-binding protein
MAIARILCTILQNVLLRLAEHGARREESPMHTLDLLADIIARHSPEPGIIQTSVPRLAIIRANEPTVPVPAVYEASLCLIAQGAKRVSLGDLSMVYDQASYLVVSLDLPLVGHVIEASRDAPYLCCKIDLDMTALADLLLADGGPGPKEALSPLAVYPSDPELIDAVLRLAKLLDTPQAVSALAPLIEREILYRLLVGPHGPMLRHVASAESHLNQIVRAIAAIREGYDQQLRIEQIAAAAGMSSSSLHAHFKAVTRMTPLEYQKQLRLQEARRLMLAEGANAGSAGFAVGYDSQSQFSREYRRLFGAPPRQDIERMRMAGTSMQAA